jgi:tetratricopeptide (TPR) repeat protein
MVGVRLISKMQQALALHLAGRLDEALISYDRIIAIKPDFADAYSNRGAAFAALNRPNEALHELPRS